MDVVPLAFAPRKHQSAARTDTDSSVIRTIINVTFSFLWALHQSGHSQLNISAWLALLSQNKMSFVVGFFFLPNMSEKANSQQSSIIDP